jgi:tyrosine-protein phosphatase MSG5
MPSAAARRLYEDHLPLFMSILDPEADSIDDRGGPVAVVGSKFLDMEPACAPQLPSHVREQQAARLAAVISDGSHRHNDSSSTQNSESADSSPTTTLTTDTSSLSDPSPSSSPDSPVSLVPLSSFQATSFGGLPSTMDTLTADKPPIGPGHLQRPVTSPSPRRARNMKGLSIQPPFPNSLSASLVSEPASPSANFIKPKIAGMKRKPSQLSVKTDSAGLNIRPTLLEVPSSPGFAPMLQRRALKHSTSSPHMLSGLMSATFGPVGGMTFPTVLERGETGLSEVLRPSNRTSAKTHFDGAIMEEESPIRSQEASRTAMDFAPFHDESELNEDEKSPGYPDGPVAIYDDNVFLYLEPTADEAAKFDVVINVAREVLNPFGESDAELEPTEPLPAVQSPVPDTAATTQSFATAFEYQLDRVETPTTPKAPDSTREPEYIHIPWDHNTDIATDLMMLCETIERRTLQGKKVLVHCQQGASRSASLIIAYGLYKNPGMSVNDAYYAAQSKSRWISPNMRLMYCLQDFQKQVAKKKMPRSAMGPRSGRSPTKHRLTLSADALEMPPKTPLSAPLPDESPVAQGLSPERSPMHSRGKSTPNLEGVSPGPSSAPSSLSWLEREHKPDPGKVRKLDREQVLGPPKLVEPEPEYTFPPSSSSFYRPPPSPGFMHLSRPQDLRPPPSPGFVSISQNFAPPSSPGFRAHRLSQNHRPLGFASLSLGKRDGMSDMSPPRRASEDEEFTISPPRPVDAALLSPRAGAMTNNPLHESYSGMAGLTFMQVPSTANEELFSPRQMEFPRDSFFSFGRPARIADPRSPPTKGETPIVRSIDELI